MIKLKAEDKLLPVGVMVDKAGSHTNPKVTGDVLSKAGNFRT